MVNGPCTAIQRRRVLVQRLDSEVVFPIETVIPVKEIPAHK